MTFYKTFGCWLQVFTLKTCVITPIPIQYVKIWIIYPAHKGIKFFCGLTVSVVFSSCLSAAAVQGWRHKVRR